MTPTTEPPPDLHSTSGSAPTPSKTTAISNEVIEQAAHWLVQLQTDNSASTQAACLLWRQAHPDHERAWQRFGALQQNIGTARRHLPAGAAAETLLSASRQIERRRAVKWVFGLTGVGVLAWQMRTTILPASQTADYRTLAGQRRAVTLPDDTRLMLNTATALDVEYTDTQRILRLHAGEVLVSTGADAAQRPLLLNTRHGSVRPIGPRFSVRQHEGEGRPVHIAVAEGTVELATAANGQRQLLSQGQQAWLRADGVSAPSVADIAQSMAWEHGMLIANRMRLDDFLRELGRYRTGVLRCDPAVASRLITGTFRTDDTDQVLQALADALGLQVRYRTRYWVSVMAADA